MNSSRWLVRVLSSVLVLATLVLTAVALPPRVAADQQVGIVGSVTSVPAGTFNGIDYVKYNGRFKGLADVDYDVPFEIIAPADPVLGNGITIIEPFRPPGSSGGLNAYLTPEFLFERGFSHAGIGWHQDEVLPDAGYSTAEAIEILYNFGMTLREDDTAYGLVGEVQMLYSTGVSLASEPLLSLLASEYAGVLDFSFLFVPTLKQQTYAQHQNANNIMVFLTEAEFVRVVVEGAHAHAAALRGSSLTYRSYEVAGGPHIPDVPGIRALFGDLSKDTTPLDWTPVARALFLAGHRWTTEGTEPPPSAYLTLIEEPDVPRDPVYWTEYGLELKTRIVRDDNGNALGGIRLPDLEVGRGQYIAVDPGSFLLLFGDWNDLKCAPLPDGSARFRNHGSYVSQYAHQAQSLVKDGFLLPEDAQLLISKAARSEVGKPKTCH